MAKQVLSKEAAQPYIDIYRASAAKLAELSHPLLESRRPCALEMLGELGFPTARHEDYRHTPVDEWMSYNYGLNLNNIQFPLGDIKQFECDLLGEKGPQAIIRNELFSLELSARLETLPRGIFVGSLGDFLRRHPEKQPLLESVYGRYAEIDTDGMVALNTLFARDALLIYAAPGCRTETPIRLTQLVRAGLNMLLNRRVLIYVDQGASLEVLSCDHTLDERQFLINQVVEIHVAKEGKLKYYDLEESSRKTNRFNSLMLRQEAESEVLLAGLTLNNGSSRNNIRTRFLGEHGRLTLAGLAIGNGSQQIDNLTRIEHVKPHCYTNEIFRYVLQEEAAGAFAGRIFVALGAQKTEAYQQNRNLLLSPEAKMWSKPQLEIYADDVQCSHGMTTGQLDEEALFYMQQRGVSLEEARTLLSVAFADEVIKLIPLVALREAIEEVIRSRFDGREMRHCHRCGKVCF